VALQFGHITSHCIYDSMTTLRYLETVLDPFVSRTLQEVRQVLLFTSH